jgi:hypothetical protein
MPLPRNTLWMSLRRQGCLLRKVGAFARAVEAAGQVDLGEVLELRGAAAVVVGERQRHLRHAERRLAVGAGEDDVLHRFPAQLLDALLAHDPADGVDDVALPAAVRADHRGDAVGEIDDGLFEEGFEPRYFESFELHGPFSYARELPVV